MIIGAQADDEQLPELVRDRVETDYPCCEHCTHAGPYPHTYPCLVPGCP